MLTEMDVANASMYDGASACAETVMMAKAATKRNKIVVLKGLNYEYLQVLKTYAGAASLELIEVEAEELESALDKETSCVVAQQPDFLGRIVELEEIAGKVHGKNALLVVAVTEAISLGFLNAPGKQGADIVALDAQSFGNAMSFGGPHPGVIACKQELIRQIPGRLVGRTVDSEGKEGFVLTMQAREQHIRREKAGSNICSNQALCALASTVYLATLGEQGLKDVAKQNNENANYLAKKLKEKGFELPPNENFFNEFVAKKPGAKKLQERLLGKGFVFGHALSEDELLVAVTEMNSKEEIDALVNAVGEAK